MARFAKSQPRGGAPRPDGSASGERQPPDHPPGPPLCTGAKQSEERRFAVTGRGPEPAGPLLSSDVRPHVVTWRSNKPEIGPEAGAKRSLPESTDYFSSYSVDTYGDFLVGKTRFYQQGGHIMVEEPFWRRASRCRSGLFGHLTGDFLCFRSLCPLRACRPASPQAENRGRGNQERGGGISSVADQKSNHARRP